MSQLSEALTAAKKKPTGIRQAGVQISKASCTVVELRININILIV